MAGKQFSSIPDPGIDPTSLHAAVLALKQTVEVLIGARGTGQSAAVLKSQLPANIQDTPAASVKAWVIFTGSTAAILDSYNIASVVRNSAGNYTITFNTPFASANYVCQITIESSSGGVFGFVVPATRTAGTITIQVDNAALSAAADPSGQIHVAFFGRQ